MAFFWKRKDAAKDAVETAVPEDSVAAGGEPGAGQADADASAPVAAQDEPVAPCAPPSEPAAEDEPQPQKSGFFGRVKEALSQRIKRTRDDIVGQIRAAIKAASIVDENLIERIEEILIKADVGAETTLKIVDEMREFEARGAKPNELLDCFKAQLQKILEHDERVLAPPHTRPCVILVVGVNGVGKTTTIGKLASEFQARGRKTMLVAGDTFRAAAIEQLEIWAKRTSSTFVSKAMGADPAGIAFDAVTQATREGCDVVLIDTAGRLHTKANLMEELKKIVRVLQKLMPGAPHETLLVLDATTGQNAISQAKVFTEAIPVTGLVMTKLDGTAKGGVLIGVRNLFKVPVLKIGVGEGIDDLRDFSPTEFVDALFVE